MSARRLRLLVGPALATVPLAHRSGLADMRLRFAVNLVGGPVPSALAHIREAASMAAPPFA